MLLCERRKQKHMTQESLAKILGIDRSAVSKWETGETMPSVVMLKKLSVIFECTIDELLED